VSRYKREEMTMRHSHKLLLGLLGGVSGWTPRQLGASLQGWWDASDSSTLFQDDAGTTLAVADGDAVGYWADKSGNNRHLAQSTTSAKPTLQTSERNGRNTVRFDGGDWLTKSYGVTLTQPFAVFVVVIQPSGNGNIYDGTAVTDRVVLNSTNPDVWAGSAVPGVATMKPAWNVYTAIYNTTSSSLRTNGLQTASGNAGTRNMAGFTVGASFAGSTGLTGDIAEIIVIDPLPDTTTIELVENYLINKWSLYRMSGGWSWFSSPNAVRVGDTTFISSVYNGTVSVSSYNHSTGVLSNAFPLRAIGNDDHDNAALLVRASDNKLMAFYCHHLGTEYYQQVSTNALDVSAWGTASALDASLGMDSYTYANPIQLTGETNDPIWLFFRGDPPGAAQWGQYYSKSEDGGATWAAAVRWLANGAERPYIRFAQNGDARIDFSCTDGHPLNVATNSLYHGYYTAGNLYKSDGTLVGAIDAGPYAPSAFTKIYDGTTNRAWVQDIAIDNNGDVVVVYDVFPSTTDHRYRFARWAGSSWSDAEVATAGTYLYAAEPYYSGGAAIDPLDVDILYLSRDTGGANHQMWKYITADDGATWTGAQLTSGSSRAIRPFVVRGHGGDKKLAYMLGTYTTFTNYDTSIILSDG
jgi:hypothetical protein